MKAKSNFFLFPRWNVRFGLGFDFLKIFFKLLLSDRFLTLKNECLKLGVKCVKRGKVDTEIDRLHH